MKYQRILIGAAIGTAVAGVGFLLFHPAGKKFRSKAADIGLEAADKFIDYLRTKTPEFQGSAEKFQAQAKAASVAGSV